MGAGEECWVIAQEILHGNPAHGEVWDQLEDCLRSTFLKRDGRTLRIRTAAIDTGFLGAKVYDFCKRKRATQTFAIKGRGGPIPVFPTRASKGGANKREKVHIVGTDTCKDALHERLKIDAPGPGYIHFAAELVL